MKKAIANYCVDSRLEGFRGVIEHMLGVDKIFRFKLAGPDGVWTLPELATEREGNLAGLKRLDQALGGADAFVFVGHTHCAGYVATDEEHRQATLKAAKTMKESLSCNVPVYALLAVRGASDDIWTFEQLATL